MLEGQMEAVVGETTEILSPGDSIYYDSIVPHQVRGASPSPARILAVARSLLRLMSPKDEYEVARLFTNGSLQQALAASPGASASSSEGPGGGFFHPR